MGEQPWFWSTAIVDPTWVSMAVKFSLGTNKFSGLEAYRENVVGGINSDSGWEFEDKSS